MENMPESAKKISELRASRRESQAEFAKVLGVTQPMISAWEGGSDVPSLGAYVRMGNLAPFPDNVWFWKQAGLDEQAVLSAAEKVIEQRSVPLPETEIVRVPWIGEDGERIEDAGPPFLLPAEIVPHPLSTVCMEIGDRVAGPRVFSGDIVALDVSQKSAIDLYSFWEQTVLARVGIRRLLCMGQLRLKKRSVSAMEMKTVPQKVSHWFATLTDPADFAKEMMGRRAAADNEIIVGEWSLPIPEGTLDVQTQAERSEKLRDFEKKIRGRAVREMKLASYCEILGIVVAWIPWGARPEE
jgi:transcriptional regulator with XRE-family HTH domain